MKEVAGFEELKERTWEKMKDRLKDVCNKKLIHSAEEMAQGMAGISTGRWETLLELVSDFEKTYTAAKRGMNRLDCSDLERLTLNSLRAGGEPGGGGVASAICTCWWMSFRTSIRCRRRCWGRCGRPRSDLKGRGICLPWGM